tara:strand:- start:322 stop:504 length:183 start_codon:yes stop_codon:yes gene_type:complete
MPRFLQAKLFEHLNQLFEHISKMKIWHRRDMHKKPLKSKTTGAPLIWGGLFAVIAENGLN